MPEGNGFDQFCIVELFGHARIAGKVTEQVIGGQGFVRVDVPGLPADKYHLEEPAFTRFFGTGAIFSITPVDEETALRAALSMRVEPVSVYLAAPQITAGRVVEDSEYPEFTDDENDEHPADCDCQDCRDRYDGDDDE